METMNANTVTEFSMFHSFSIFCRCIHLGSDQESGYVITVEIPVLSHEGGGDFINIKRILH